MDADKLERYRQGRWLWKSMQRTAARMGIPPLSTLIKQDDLDHFRWRVEPIRDDPLWRFLDQLEAGTAAPGTVAALLNDGFLTFDQAVEYVMQVSPELAGRDRASAYLRQNQTERRILREWQAGRLNGQQARSQLVRAGHSPESARRYFDEMTGRTPTSEERRLGEYGQAAR